MFNQAIQKAGTGNATQKKQDIRDVLSPLTCQFLRAHKFKMAGINTEANDTNDFD